MPGDCKWAFDVELRTKLFMALLRAAEDDLSVLLLFRQRLLKTCRMMLTMMVRMTTTMMIRVIKVLITVGLVALMRKHNDEC